jgi:putative PIN family toxin of toxin-antitoxin system
VKIVFDTNILARAHLKATGTARRALLLAATGPHILITSSYILVELERVLTYPRLLKRSGLGPADIAEYLEHLSAMSQLVEPIAVPPHLIRDPADEAILGTALAARAEFLCTLDADLREDGVRMFAHLSGTEIVTDVELLNRL